MTNKCYCKRCGKTMSDLQFYTYKNGEKSELCKKCLTAHVDPFDESTYIWLIKKMDVPYLKQEWIKTRDTTYAANPKKFNGTTVFGKYLAKMRLKRFKDYGFDDSEELESLEKKRTEKDIQEQNIFDKELLQKYEAGEISEAEYRTLASTEIQYNTDSETPYTEQQSQQSPQDDEVPDLAKELTKEDRIYLLLKWGRNYTPNEWIELEKKYNEMIKSFDIDEESDSDTTGSLILLCKT